MPRTSTLRCELSLCFTACRCAYATDVRVEKGDDGSGGDCLTFGIGETSSKHFGL